jgi:hypothetical protein
MPGRRGTRASKIVLEVFETSTHRLSAAAIQAIDCLIERRLIYYRGSYCKLAD